MRRIARNVQEHITTAALCKKEGEKVKNYYKVCPRCNANLDPGEHCNCEQEREDRNRRIIEMYKAEKDTGQITFDWEMMKA